MTILDTILDYPPSSTSSHHIFRCWWWWHDGGRFLSEEMSGIKMLRVQNFGLVVLWIRDEERLSSSSSIIYNELLYDDINLSCCFRDDYIIYDTSSQTGTKITWPAFQPMLFDQSQMVLWCCSLRILINSCKAACMSNRSHFSSSSSLFVVLTGQFNIQNQR